MNNIDNFRRALGEIQSSTSLNRDLYGPSFYTHLDLLFKPNLIDGGLNLENFHFDMSTYQGLKQFAVESLPMNESSGNVELDWNYIADAKDVVRTMLRKSLGVEKNSDHLKPFIKFTLDGYEDYLIYESIDAHSPSNPWTPFKEIVHRGVLLLGSDDTLEVISYSPKWFSRPRDESNYEDLQVIAASGKKNGFGGFQIDRRHTAQAIVFEHLRSNTNSSNPLSRKNIGLLLKKNEFSYSPQEITDSITLPLKREGLIGSNVKGFFYIGNEVDLIESVDHHLSNLRGIQRTLELYRRKAMMNGWDVSRIPQILIGEPDSN